MLLEASPNAIRVSGNVVNAVLIPAIKLVAVIFLSVPLGAIELSVVSFNGISSVPNNVTCGVN